MRNMTEEEKIALMGIVRNLKLPMETSVWLCAMMDEKRENAAELVKYIKNNPNATETELINKALEIGDTP